ncbi:HAD hydrolase family protein [Yinghuangia seranimata]|uniref:HAD hydrolase family protein n=1 Tax=Yinghuangia seranimata TaxID=408067 RepID=UPI00248AF37C|nr:HAD hydrolase family protein [Yinghuangia seranimata]MDI2130700.1 HAD hydrolase family protein [Yinghuangia seranimata]
MTTGPSRLPALLATDLDGTLLRDDHTVSPRTAAALAAAEDAGVDVLFVTGRPAWMLARVAAVLPRHGMVVCNNGAAVVDVRGGTDAPRFVTVDPLAGGTALAAVEALRRAVPGTMFAVERTHSYHREADFPPVYLTAGSAPRPVEELLDGDHDDAPVLKVLAHHPALDPADFLALARGAAGDHVQVTQALPMALVDLSARGVSKGSALARHCAERGIAAEEVVAFGDMPNDVEMLAWAGTSYAMGNAHPAALAAATHRTADNNGDGVAVVIEHLLATAHR